jgi:hypothetical protein
MHTGRWKVLMGLKGVTVIPATLLTSLIFFTDASECWFTGTGRLLRKTRQPKHKMPTLPRTKRSSEYHMADPGQYQESLRNDSMKLRHSNGSDVLSASFLAGQHKFVCSPGPMQSVQRVFGFRQCFNGTQFVHPAGTSFPRRSVFPFLFTCQTTSSLAIPHQVQDRH